MTRPRGYRWTLSLRRRQPDKRGGHERPPDGFDRNGLTLAVYADRYIEHMRVLNRTDDAVSSSRRDVHRFLRWTHEREIVRPEQVTLTILEGYQRWLWHFRKPDGKPLSVSAQYNYLGAVRTLFSWLCRQHVLQANPASDLEFPNLNKQLPVEALSVSQVEALMAAPNVSDPLGIRDRAMLELFYSTAIRRSEMTRLKTTDLNIEKRVLWVRLGKGRKDRVVPVGQRALAWVEKYTGDVRPLLAVDPVEQALFLTGYGHAFSPLPLGRLVKEYMRTAGIDRPGQAAHLLRHTCATHMLENGADIRYIQQLLGHESLDTTAIYTEVNITQLQAVHARTHPAEARGMPKPPAGHEAEAASPQPVP